MLSQRRRHSRWRMFLVLLVFVGLIRHSELTSASIPESSSLTSSAPVARKKSQDFSSLGDFSWQAWFMVDSQAGGQPGMDATLLRRITPKSVFIAPALPACADGYEADDMGRCVKHVDINRDAHFNFLLQRLNNLYANHPSPSQNKQPTGPLQVNIPLMPSLDSELKVEPVDTLSENDPLTAVVDDIGLGGDNIDKANDETMATMYEVKNDTASDDDDDDDDDGDKEQKEDTAFFHGASKLEESVDESDRKPEVAVPVAEFVEEANNTGFSDVVDYKIPDLKTLLNASGAKGFNASDVSNESAPVTDKQLINSTESLPLILSSTTVPDTTSRPEDLPSAENNTVSHAIKLTFNHTSHVPVQEIINDTVSNSYDLPPAWKSSDVDNRRDNETRVEDKSRELEESPKLTHETDFIYDEEVEDDEYAYGTDIPDEESTEGEELLKHGEAGMTIPTRAPSQLHRDQQRLQQQQQNETAEQKKADGQLDQVVIRFNDSAAGDKDEIGSNISSEVSIDGDLILETTLLDVNTEKLQVTSTQSPDATSEAGTKNDGNDAPKEPYDQDHQTSAPEVVFPLRDTHSTSTQDRAESSTRLAEGTVAENGRREHDDTLGVASPSSDALLYDPPEEDHITEIHTIDEERLGVPEESALEDNSKDFETTPRSIRSDSPENSARVPPNHDPLEDFVRFPGPVRQQQQQAYVRFPANEANSIHSPNYKHHSRQVTPNDGVYSSTSTKSSVPTRQKPVYHLTASSWKPDRQQDERTAAQRQKQTIPALFRLWNKMPPIRDPAIFPIDQFPSRSENDDSLLEGGPPVGQPRRGSSSRRNRADKAPARERRRTPISG